MPGQVIARTPRKFKPIGQPWRNCYSEVGRMYPQSEMTEYQGHWYCHEHARTKINKELMFIPVEITEDKPDNEQMGQDFTAVIPDTYGNTDRS